LYFIDFFWGRRKVSDIEFHRLLFRDGPSTRFIGFDDQGAVAITRDGVITRLDDKSGASISPDNQWMGLYDKEGINLYDESDHLVSNISSMYPQTWRPDSTGLFLEKSENLYYMDIPNGEPVLVDTCQAESCHYCGMGWDCAWLP
jgi:hypothetical protein